MPQKDLRVSSRLSEQKPDATLTHQPIPCSLYPAAATGKLKPGQFIRTINGEALKDIDPRIQLGNPITKAEATALAEESMNTGYTGYEPWNNVDEYTEEAVNSSNREIIMQSMASLPGGYHSLHDMLVKLYPDESMPYKRIFLSADPKALGPNLHKKIAGTALTELIPNHIAQNRKDLLAEATSTPPKKSVRKASRNQKWRDWSSSTTRPSSTTTTGKTSARPARR